jgi:hypothetical protein
LRFRSNLGTNLDFRRRGIYNDRTSLAQANNRTAVASTENIFNRFLNWDNILTYSREIGKHSLTLTGITSYIRSDIDNTYASEPQVGLGKADMVVEELVEGGMTRLAVFYYSQIPGEVGPVRSMRASDIGIVSPVDADVVTSGAAQVTLNRIAGAGIEYFTEGDKGFFRDSGRSAPYNLFTDLSQTATLAEEDEPRRPADYLPWGDEADFPQGQPAASLAASFSGGHTTNWTFAGGTYTNENTYAGEGDEFPADTVLVLRVRVGDAGYRDPAGNPVPETQFTGKGQALIFHAGRLVRGQWTKESLEAPLELATEAGDLTVPAGRTWIELVPQDGGKVTFGK